MKRLYNVEEVAIMLNLQKESITRYIADGKLKAQTIEGKRYISEDDLKEFVLGK